MIKADQKETVPGGKQFGGKKAACKQKSIVERGANRKMDKKSYCAQCDEYKKQSFLTPVLVAAEVFVEVLIPL